jgi:Holliday junction resolvase RusA-like endonuclease
MILFSWDCPLKPITVNHAIKHGRRGSYKTAALNEFVRLFKICLTQHGKKPIPESALKLTIMVIIPRNVFYTKKGKIAKKKNDVSNFIKYIEDGVAKHLGFDDSLVCDLVVSKRSGDNWRISGNIQQSDAT